MVQSKLLQRLHSGNPAWNWPAKSIVVQAQGYKRGQLGNLEPPANVMVLMTTTTTVADTVNRIRIGGGVVKVNRRQWLQLVALVGVKELCHVRDERQAQRRVCLLSRAPYTSYGASSHGSRSPQHHRSYKAQGCLPADCVQAAVDRQDL